MTTPLVPFDDHWKVVLERDALKAEAERLERRFNEVIQDMKRYEDLEDHLLRQIDKFKDMVRDAADERDAALAQLAEERKRVDQLGNRIDKMREAVLEARREGCACDWHLYGEDTELLTPEALDAYCTLEQRNTKLECEAITATERIGYLRDRLESAIAHAGRLAEALEKVLPVLDEAMDLLSWLKHDAYPVIKGDYNGKIPCCQHDGEEALHMIRKALAEWEAK